jgi:hypothetical protein
MKYPVVAALLYISSVVYATSLSDFDTICRNCTADGNKIFLKVIYQPFARAEYVCRQSATLVSKFGIIVDRSCSPAMCLNFTARPITRSFGRLELDCSDGVEYTDHYSVITIIKDYLEIIFMSTILALILLKKSLLEKCLQKKTSSFFGVKNHFDTKSDFAEPPVYGTNVSEENSENQQKPERQVMSDQLESSV